MTMRHIGLSTLFVLVLLSVAVSEGKDQPIFASRASYVYRGIPAISPDKKKSVSAKVLGDNPSDFPTEMRVRTGNGVLTSRIKFGLNAEVLWSPDSQAFTVTGSQDGANGLYLTDVFFIRSGKLVQVPLTPLIVQAFGHPVKCGWPEMPNVVAVKWLQGSEQLLLAAQIIHHSNCDSFGTFKGFVVDVKSRQIIKSYDQLEMKRIFHTDLGPELQAADDGCIRSPGSCYVSTNHSTKKPVKAAESSR